MGGSAAYFSGYGVRRQPLVDKKGYFPSGLLRRLPFKADQVIDNRIKPLHKPHSRIFPANPYPWQVDAVKAACKANRGIITAPTGTGKSLAIMLLISTLNTKTLIVVPSLEIKRQLQDDVKSNGLSHLVTVDNIDSTALKTKPKIPYDMLIIDEGHHVSAKTYRKLNKMVWDGIFYRFYFTATPFRNDSEETILFEAIAGQVIYKLDYKTAVAKGYIVPLEAYYIDVSKQDTDAFTYREVYNQLVVNNSVRNEKICMLLHSLAEQGKSTLCLVKEIQHGKNINYPYFVHGGSEDRRLIADFNAEKVRSLVATMGICGEGLDTKPCEFVIIAGLGKAKSQFMQMVGRGLRRYPGKESAKVLLFKDRSHRFCTRHYRAQCAILKEEYGITPLKLDI